MRKTISIIKQDEQNVAEIMKNGVSEDILFRELQKDTIGRNGSNPTWGYVYSNDNGKLNFKGVALHKEYDYDFPMATYSEKTWSIFGREVLGDRVRVPFIDIVKTKDGHEEVISYRVMDNNKEDMIHIKDILFNKFERDEIKDKKSIYTIEELLECVRLQINNEENYKEIKRAMIQVLLLDAITNNADRHVLNWALVRDKESNKYELAVFDHSASFIDMFDNKERFLVNRWAPSFITVGKDKGRKDIGSCGDKIIQYISDFYPEYFEEFCDIFDKKLPTILEQVNAENMKIDINRLKTRIGEKKRFLSKIRSKGEFEYE